MGLGFLERLPTNYLEITIHQFESDQVSIRFIRNKNSLLSLDLLFSPTHLKIIVSSYLPEYSTTDNNRISTIISRVPISALQVRYNTRQHLITLSLIQHISTINGVTVQQHWTKKIKIKDFSYEWVGLLDIRASLADLNLPERRYQQTLQKFVDASQSLPSYDELRELIRKDQVEFKQLTELFQESWNQSNRDCDQHKQLISNMVTIMGAHPKSPKQLRPSTTKQITVMSYEVNLVTTENRDNRLTLTPDGHFTLTWKKSEADSESKLSGSWNTTPGNLFLFPKGDGPPYKLRVYGDRFYDKESETFWRVDDDTGKIGVNDIIDARDWSKRLVIMVITCRKRLPLVEAINKCWGKQLTTLGIRVLFVIGGCSEDKIEGQFVNLRCPDNYESLPQKIFRASQLILKTLTFTHLYKIDDDTLVNPRQLLSLVLDKHHYLGRKQTVTNEFNRFWHRGKCENQSLHHIPYPVARIRYGTTYAKGEAGYFLSRRAVEMLGKFQHSICSDLYEDKAIGDALLQANLTVSEDPAYQTKLAERFSAGTKLDRYSVIVDIGSNMVDVYRRCFTYYLAS